jgi:hypothetical protein
MKKIAFYLPVQKLLLLLLPKFYISFLGKNQTIIFEQDKRQRPLWMQVRKRMQPIRPAYVELQSYGGRCCFITILKNMKNIKNYFHYAIWSEAGLTDFRLFTLLQKGSAVRKSQKNFST